MMMACIGLKHLGDLIVYNDIVNVFVSVFSWTFE